MYIQYTRASSVSSMVYFDGMHGASVLIIQSFIGA